jgi:thymidine kinase
MKGNLKVVTGPMFGRKSLDLIEEIKALEFSDTKYVAFSPIKEVIFSRGSNVQIPAIYIPREHPGFISYQVGVRVKAGEEIKAVAIDEVSFYADEIVSTVMSLLDSGIDVIVAGLDQDFRGRPFGSIGDLMALATEVRKLHSVCMKCKKALATMTQRLMEDGVTPAPFSSQLIAVENETKTYKYQCRCKDCHERG